MATLNCGLALVEPTALYSLPQVAKALCVGWETVKGLIEDGSLRFVMVGKRKKILGMDVLGYIGLQGPMPPTPDEAEVQRQLDEALQKSRAFRRRRPSQQKAAAA